MVKLLRRYADTEMDQWETFSFTSSYGETYLLLTVAQPQPPDGFHNIDGFTAGTQADEKRPVDEGAEGWTFPFDGAIDRLLLDRRVVLELTGGAKVVIETTFTVTIDGTTTHVDPGTPTTVAPALALLRRPVESMKVSSNGALVVDLADGARIEVSVDPAYENWQLILPDSGMYIGLPGGGVATFPAP